MPEISYLPPAFTPPRIVAPLPDGAHLARWLHADALVKPAHVLVAVRSNLTVPLDREEAADVQTVTCADELDDWILHSLVEDTVGWWPSREEAINNTRAAVAAPWSDHPIDIEVNGPDEDGHLHVGLLNDDCYEGRCPRCAPDEAAAIRQREALLLQAGV
jgi:hypothetical protein